MGDNVIKFGKAINRARFGQKKSAKELKKALAEKLQAKLDGHKIDSSDKSD